MKIGLILPSLLAAKRYKDRIFAPKDLFILLANGLVDKGHQVFVYTSPNIKTKAKVINFNLDFETEDIPSVKDLRHDQTYINRLTFIRNLYEYEIIIIGRAIAHANQHKLDILHDYLGYLSHYFNDLATMPVVYTLHDPVFPPNTLEYTRLKMALTHQYLAISNYQKEEYLRLMNINCIDYIYHGLDLSDFTYSETPQKHMSFLGRYIEAKGVIEAISVAQQLKIPLQLASSKNYQTTDYYKKYIQPNLNTDYIEELDFLGHKARSEFLGKAKLTLLPIKWSEPFGMTIIESMACGTPVIAFAQGSIPEIIKDGETGFIVNSSDRDIRGDWIIKKTGIEGLTEAVKKIYAMPQNEYQNMRRSCRKHVEDKFTVEKMVDGYERVYQKILTP